MRRSRIYGGTRWSGFLTGGQAPQNEPPTRIIGQWAVADDGSRGRVTIDSLLDAYDVADRRLEALAESEGVRIEDHRIVRVTVEARVKEPQ